MCSWNLKFQHVKALSVWKDDFHAQSGYWITEPYSTLQQLLDFIDGCFHKYTNRAKPGTVCTWSSFSQLAAIGRSANFQNSCLLRLSFAGLGCQGVRSVRCYSAASRLHFMSQGKTRQNVKPSALGWENLMWILPKNSPTSTTWTITQ